MFPTLLCWSVKINQFKCIVEFDLDLLTRSPVKKCPEKHLTLCYFTIETKVNVSKKKERERLSFFS